MPSEGGQGILACDMSEEPEDLNEFNSWDVLGAMLMLTLVPAIMYFVFNDKELVMTGIIAAVGVVISVAVFLLALVTHWRVISKVVNMLGWVLTLLYIAVAVYLWSRGGDVAEVVPDAPEPTQFSGH